MLLYCFAVGKQALKISVMCNGLNPTSEKLCVIYSLYWMIWRISSNIFIYIKHSYAQLMQPIQKHEKWSYIEAMKSS